jgi:hypothetical protein
MASGSVDIGRRDGFLKRVLRTVWMSGTVKDRNHKDTGKLSLAQFLRLGKGGDFREVAIFMRWASIALAGGVRGL